MSIISDIAGAASAYYNYRSARDFAPPPAQIPALFGQNDQIGLDGGLRVGSPSACGDGSCGSPRYLTYDCKTGEYKPRRRRRRRKALTKSDMMDLEFVSSLPNTANVKAFLSRLGR